MVDATTPNNTTIPAEIPFAEFKNAFALRGKNMGCSVQLRGRVVLVAFLINDGESHWDDESQKIFAECLKQSTNTLMDSSNLGREDLDIAYAYCQVTVPYPVEKRNSNRFVQDVLRQFGYEDVQSYQQHYENKFARDEACVSFVFNKSFRSYAVSVSGTAAPEGENSAGNEYSIVAFNPKNPTDSQRTFIHELMHQFGAVDLYYPERVKIEAQQYLPGSIMNGGSNIDDLTRYVIGWTDDLSQNAQAFLRTVSKISPAEIAAAARAQWQD